MTITNQTRLLSCVALLSLTCITMPTEAQDALGTGNALDANTRQGSYGRNTARRDFATELRYRNAVITGNAPGGFSFRGDVGYGASREFRGSLGSDDLFGFRRDTYLSSMLSLGGENLRSSDALFIQSQLQTTGTTAFGFNPIVSRSSPSSATAESGFLDPSVNPSLARFSERPGALRATSSFVTGQALSPSVIQAPSRSDETIRYMVVSPIIGISEREVDAPTESENRVSTQSDSRVETRTTGRLDARAGQAETPSLLERLRSHYEQDEDEQLDTPGETLESRIERVREEMDRLRRNDPEDEGDISEAADALRSDEPFEIERFVDSNLTDESFFQEHMKKGQELLGEGRWFLAEERFGAALRINSGNPLAMAGRLHAQLGAGLFRSAIISLHSLFDAHPEMLGVRYDSALLPSESRLDLLLVSFRSQSGGDSGSDRDTAFLMAYLAWQLDRKDILSEAFVQIERINDELEDVEPLYELARELWLPLSPAPPLPE
ncbi:MAG: hypothetical protein ACF8GE_11795 [Phycisphaerales bacterium JB043]